MQCVGRDGEPLRCGAVAFVYQGDEVAGTWCCRVDGLTRAFDANLFDGVVGVAQAGGVDEAEVIVAEFDCLFDGIAGCTVYVADYGAVVTDEGVEQR